MNDPEPDESSSSEPQEPVEGMQESTTLSAAALQVSVISFSGGSVSILAAASFQKLDTLRLESSFTLDGFLKTGNTCCVSGGFKTVSLEDASGFSLAANWGSIEIALVSCQG
jgi:hypothetical protein